MQNVITGPERNLFDALKYDIERATEVKIIVSFLRETGVKLLIPDLDSLVDRGVPIKILTGSYLNITEPSALYLLKDRYGEKIELRLFQSSHTSFHPKTYILHAGEEGALFIGSSNISRSALINGIEWNYRLERSLSLEDYDGFDRAFDEIFEEKSLVLTDELLRLYASSWKKPRAMRELDLLTNKEELDSTIVEPRGAQIEALYELKIAREEGINRGLVVAATGVGKTYLAAFDAKGFERVLFIAHRKEILEQAAKTFHSVSPEKFIGFFGAEKKDTKADFVFASVQTLGKADYLTDEYFAKDDFDYIVIDEFHHVAADSYRKLFEYFEPNFLLGLTATPFRMDQKDIFEFCDDNVVYEVHLRDAIERDLLVPFRYYAVYDETDYSQVREQNGRYVQKDLEKVLSQSKRAQLILDKFKRFKGKRCLGFCTSINHAEYMASYFSNHGINAVAVHSRQEEEMAMDRDDAIDKLRAGEVDIVFAVDIFNEGVDIPEIDMILLLRPTESYTIFLQQLGRGLRKHEGKDYLKVLDFIGNYKRAHYLPYLLSGDNPLSLDKAKAKKAPQEIEYPENCQVQFDFKLIDLFEQMRKNDPLSERLKQEFYRLKNDLGRRPTRKDLLEGTDLQLREYLKKGYLQFLRSIGELTDQEAEIISPEVEAFLKEMEKTSMSKSYKIPTLMAFLGQNETLRMTVTADEVAESFYHYYNENKIHQKDLHNKSNKDWRDWKMNRFKSLAIKNPIHFLSKGRNSQYFSYDPESEEFTLKQSLSADERKVVYRHFRDIVETRNIEYFRRRYKESLLGRKV